MLEQRQVISWAVTLCPRRSRYCLWFPSPKFYSLYQHRSSHTASCRLHAKAYSHSPVCCVVRLASTAHSGITDARSPSAPWERLVHLITDQLSPEEQTLEPTAADPSTLAGVNEVSVALPAIRELWLSAYHPIFCIKRCNKHRVVDLPETHAQQHHHHRLLPEEAEFLPLFVQTLGRIAAALQSWIEEKTKTLGTMTTVALEDSTFSLEDAHVWFAELQALLLFIGRHHLRFLIPATFASKWFALNALQATEKRMMSGGSHPGESGGVCSSDAEELRVLESCDDSVAENNADHKLMNHTGELPVTIDTKLSGSGTLRRLFYRKQERMLCMVPPLPPDELLRVVVLIEAARTILDVARPSPLASGVCAELYRVLLSLVCVSEQLTSATLASLATCLARCVDSYATAQQLSAVISPSQDPSALLGEAGIGGDKGTSKERRAEIDLAALPSFLRCVSLEVTNCGSEGSLLVSPSPIERQEAARLEHLRGGLSAQLRPTVVLQHFRVLANEMQHRLAKTLYYAEAERGVREWHREADDRTRGDSADSLHTAGAARFAKESRIEMGLLGLMSLAQRKACSATATGGAEWTTMSQTRRGRRTVAQIISSADGGQVGGSDPAGCGNADVCPSQVSHTSTSRRLAASSGAHECIDANHIHDVAQAHNNFVYFSDLAEICSAMAAIGFRGDLTAAEEPMWRYAVEFACSEILAAANAKDAVDTEGPCGDGDDVAPAESRERVIRQVMQDARDVCFAVDRVGYSCGYDLIMATLVRCGFLREAIPAPSAGQRSMRSIPTSA